MEPLCHVDNWADNIQGLAMLQSRVVWPKTKLLGAISEPETRGAALVKDTLWFQRDSRAIPVPEGCGSTGDMEECH